MEMIRSKECAILKPGWQTMSASFSAQPLQYAGKRWLILTEAKERVWKMGPSAVDGLSGS